MEGLVRSQRHPTDVTKSTAAAEAYPGYQPRAPIVARLHRPRPPAPAARPMIPTPVMIRRPAPRIVADPRPAIPINPAPPPVAVGSPVCRNIRRPHIPVRRVVYPLAV